MKYRFIISSISLIVGALLMLLFMKQCNPCPEIGDTKSTIKTTRTITVEYDSTYKDAYFTLLDQIPEETPVYANKVPKRILKLIDKEDKKHPLGSIRRFVTMVNDSSDHLIFSGKIISLARGELLSTDFTFTTKSLIVNEIKTIHDSTVITNDNYILRNQLFIGIESSVHPAFNQISGTADFKTKNNWIIGYRYEHNFNFNYDAHNIKIGKVLSFRKKK